MKSITIKTLLVSVILACFCNAQVAAQAPSKALDLIAQRAQDFKLGSPRPESPTPRQTPPPRNQGWWQAFEGGWVYWTPGHGAHVVRGRIFEAWAREGWEQGTLAFPMTEEQSCRVPDSNDRYQRFEGGVIYWRVSNNTATVYHNDPQIGQTFGVNGVCYPTQVTAGNERTTAPVSTNRVEPNISTPAEGPVPAPPPTPKGNPAPSASDPARGAFRIQILGFRVEHVVHDGVLDAGDDAYVAWDAAEFDARGEIQSHVTGQSLVYGELGRNRARMVAGSRDSGGLTSGDLIRPRRQETSNDRFPMLVGDFKLVDGENAIVFAPTIWLASSDAGNYFREYRDRFRLRLRLASWDVRDSLRRNSTEFQWISSGSADVGGWFDQWILAMGEANRVDRPLGISEQLVMFPQPRGYYGAFKPHFFLLSYRSVMSFLQRSGASVDKDPVEFTARYADSGPHGIYHLLMTIQRVD